MRKKKEEKINKERKKLNGKKETKGKRQINVRNRNESYSTLRTPLWQHTERHSFNVFRKGSITNNAGLVGKKPTRGYSIPAGIKDSRL